jgi:hypothetical protein
LPSATSPDAEQVNAIIAAGRADLCALGRPHLTDPFWTLRAAAELGYKDQHWPVQYLTGRRQLETEHREGAHDMTNTFRDRHVVVTGGGGGLGGAIAAAFAAEGAVLTLMGRTQATVEERASALRRRSGFGPKPSRAM